MKILLFLVMFSMGCADLFEIPGPFMVNGVNEEIGICRFPQKYYIHTSIDSSYQAFIIDRFNEWNNVVGFEISKLVPQNTIMLSNLFLPVNLCILIASSKSIDFI
jgi:hypothetical protein